MKKLLLLFCLFAPLTAFASGEITVLDTAGQVRFVSDAEKASSLEMTVAKKDGSVPTDSKITLTSKETGKAYEATVTNGVGNFSNLPAGTYTLSSDEGLLFIDIQAASIVGATAVSGTSLAVPIVGGVAVAGGLTAVGFAIANANDNNNSTPLSPSN